MTNIEGSNEAMDWPGAHEVESKLEGNSWENVRYDAAAHRCLPGPALSVGPQPDLLDANGRALAHPVPDILRSLSPEELAHVKPLTDEEIVDALKRGRWEAEAAAKAMGHRR